MHVEIHDSFKKAMKVPASRVVVYDDFDNPIAAVVHIDGTQYVAVTAAHRNFQKVLKALGINRTVVVKHIDPKRFKPLM